MASGDRITKLKLATTYCVHGCRVISSVHAFGSKDGGGDHPSLFVAQLGNEVRFQFHSRLHLEQPRHFGQENLIPCISQSLVSQRLGRWDSTTTDWTIHIHILWYEGCDSDSLEYPS